MVTLHREVPIQVNAWVDEGIAPLVAALNRFANVITIDSCEGTNADAEGGDQHPAYVYFCCHDAAEDTFGVVQTLHRVLSARFTSCSDYKLRLEWNGSSEHPMAALYTRPARVPALAACIAEASAARTSLSVDDR